MEKTSSRGACINLNKNEWDEKLTKTMRNEIAHTVRILEVNFVSTSSIFDQRALRRTFINLKSRGGCSIGSFEGELSRGVDRNIRSSFEPRPLSRLCCSLLVQHQLFVVTGNYDSTRHSKSLFEDKQHFDITE